MFKVTYQCQSYTTKLLVSMTAVLIAVVIMVLDGTWLLTNCSRGMAVATLELVLRFLNSVQPIENKYQLMKHSCSF